jgi:alpha/beta hydrolase family protein
MRTTTSGRLLALLVALALAGCGGGGRPAAPTTGAPPASTQAASAARPECGEGIASHTIRFPHERRPRPVRRRRRLRPGRRGADPRVPAGPLGWWPYARYLSRHGARALPFDLRCFGSSPCPGGRGHALTDVAAAVAELRRRGARRVALVGASMGGSIAVVAAARRGGHGWAMLSGTTSEWSPLAATVAAFIRRHAGRTARDAYARTDATVSSSPSRNGGTSSIRSPLQKRPGSYHEAGRPPGSRPMYWYVVATSSAQ